MAFTKITDHRTDEEFYINLDQIKKIGVKRYYHVEMVDGDYYHVVLANTVITGLIRAAV